MSIQIPQSFSFNGQSVSDVDYCINSSLSVDSSEPKSYGRVQESGLVRFKLDNQDTYTFLNVSLHDLETKDLVTLIQDGIESNKTMKTVGL